MTTVRVAWGAFTQIAQLTAPDGAAEDQFGNAVAVNGNVVGVGVREGDLGANLGQGLACVFVSDLGGAGLWRCTRKLTASDGARGDSFGSSVAVSGDVMAVGAANADSPNPNQGAVYVFDRNAGGTGNWGQVKKLIVGDGAASDFLGCSVSVDQDVIVAGASGDDVGGNGNQGTANVFERNAGGPNNWGLVRQLIASDGGRNDSFGCAVAVSGDLIVVGARYHDVGANLDQGAAYLYKRDAGGAGNWGQIKKLTADDGVTLDRFGFSVSVAGDLVVVGAYWDDVGANLDQGSAYVFERNAGGENNWGQVRQLMADDGAASDLFGHAVSVSGELIVIGAKDAAVGSNLEQGVAYAFGRDTGGANNWGLIERLTSSDGAASDCFGRSVSVSGNLVVAGATQVDVGANPNQGSAYLFALPANRPPVARNDGFATTQDRPLGLPLAKLLANDSDPEDDPLSVIFVSSSINGATVLLTATNVIYTPPPGFTGVDGFTYTISDGQGGKAAAQVEVMVVSGDLPPLNHLSIQRTPAGLLLRFVGSAEGTCAWQRSTNLLNWITLSNAVVPLHGLLEFLDPDPPLPAAFYRNTWP